MYDLKSRRWKQDCKNEDLLRWSREPANAASPEAQFLRADALLEKNRRGGDVAEAVELMESAAKQNHLQAMFAMGQMFYWGWAVHKDRKTALDWFRKAAEQNYPPAQKALEWIKRRRIRNVLSVLAAVAVLIALTAGGIWLVREMAGVRVIRVHKSTELVETPTPEEFMEEITGLIAQYDDELVISGQVSTNRLILQLDGNKLDLRDFLADKVVVREDNLVIIQFATEEEARRCLEELKKREGVRFVEVDQYNTGFDSVREEDSTLPIITSVKPGNSYNSWGIADMGIDQLRDYAAANYPDNHVEAVIIDSGVSAYVEQYDEVVEIYNVVTNTSSAVPDIHGTHVTGTVLEGISGTNVHIHCLDVFNGEENASSLAILMAIEAAIQAKVDVINMSMGCGGHNEALAQAVQQAADAGIVVVKSAGNKGADTASSDGHSCPSELEDIIVVGAYDIDHNPGDFSNYGASVDVCAPGVDIYSLAYDKEGYVVSLTGTSMATPHVTALACLVKLMYPDATPAQVEMYIKDYCRTYRNPDMYATGRYGAGAPDATKFMEIEPDR